MDHPAASDPPPARRDTVADGRPDTPAATWSFVSHELRASLTVASGTLAMLESGRFGDIDAAQHHAIGMARRAVARIEALADDLSVAARIARGEWPLHRAPVALADIIADVAHALQRSHDSNTAIAVDIPPGGSAVSAILDRTAMSRAAAALARLVVREASAEAVALRVVERDDAAWLVISAAVALDDPTTTGAKAIDPATNGHGFALHVSAALLGLHGLRAVRLPSPDDVAAVGIAFPR